MALTQRPTKAPSPVTNVEQFLNKGGSVAVEAAPRRSAQHPLKFPDSDLFERLETARKAAPVRLPRNTWILQAIAEKLARDTGAAS